MHLHDADVKSLVCALDVLLDDLMMEVAAECGGSAYVPLRLTLDLDLSENDLGDLGAITLFRWITGHTGHVRCRTIRMAKNRLTDDAIIWLSEMVRAQHAAVEEIHMSQNQATTLGAAALLLAIALHPHEAYPWLNGSGIFVPAWVTFDQAGGHSLQPLLLRLRSRAGLRVCKTLGVAGGANACRLTSCAAQSRSFAAVPHVHIPDMPPSASAKYGGSLLPDVHQRIEAVCNGGDWKPSLTPATVGFWRPPDASPQVLAPSQICTQAATRREHLVVDEDAGAGIELEPVDGGLQVTEIEVFPGQPGLSVGDLIVAVDGWPLTAAACPGDDEQNERFGKSFRRGARLDVLKPSRRRQPTTTPVPAAGVRAVPNARFRCPTCMEGFNAWSPCLKHLQTMGHAPERDRREDHPTAIRRWMEECLETARNGGPAPPPVTATTTNARGRTGDGGATVTSVGEQVQAIWMRGTFGPAERCPAMLDDFASDVVFCGDRHDCVIWLRPDGLEVRSTKAGGAELAAGCVCTEVAEILRFYFPEAHTATMHVLVAAGGGPPAPAGASAVGLPTAGTSANAWGAWMMHMARQYEDFDGVGLAEDDNRVVTFDATTLNAQAPPFVPQGIAAEVSQLRVLVLCGLPGAGKSTLAARLKDEFGWHVINQDTLGSRQACMRAAREVLRRPDGHIVVDRCNVQASQRSVWLQLAGQEFSIGPPHVACVWLDVPLQVCDSRVMSRFGHETLPARANSLKVIRGFASSWEQPSLQEGFGRIWRLQEPLDFEGFWAEVDASCVARFEEAVDTDAAPPYGEGGKDVGREVEEASSSAGFGAVALGSEGRDAVSAGVSPGFADDAHGVQAESVEPSSPRMAEGVIALPDAPRFSPGAGDALAEALMLG